MNEIVKFFKEMFMLGGQEKMPVGLCSFEHTKEPRRSNVIKTQRKREMRLSELMDK